MAAIRLPTRTSKGRSRSPHGRSSKSTHPHHPRVALKSRIIRQRPLATHRRARKTVAATTVSRANRDRRDQADEKEREAEADDEVYGDENAEPEIEPIPSRTRRCTSIGTLRANVAHALMPQSERAPLGDITVMFVGMGLADGAESGEESEEEDYGEDESDEEDDDWYDGYAEYQFEAYSDSESTDHDVDDAENTFDADSDRTAASSPTFSTFSDDFSDSGTAYDPDEPVYTLLHLPAPTPVEPGAVPLALAAWIHYHIATGRAVVPWEPRGEYEDGWDTAVEDEDDSDDESSEEEDGDEGDEEEDEERGRGPLRVVNGLPDDL